MSELEAELALHIRVSDVLPTPVREHRFHPKRRWRFDFAWPDVMLACEVEGLTRNSNTGRHQTIAGAKADMEKYEAAMLLGWTVYRCHRDMIRSGRALATLETVYLQLAERNPDHDRPETEPDAP